jgi:perosamine synthetase
MTFAATAEVVRYLAATPVLVDCDAETLNMDLVDAETKLRDSTRLAPCAGVEGVRGVMPVHVGGFMMDMAAVTGLADKAGLWVVEDAAHAFPAAWRRGEKGEWTRCGENTADVTCFSFYANKTITTGEGGMATTASDELANRMRLMSLHGLSHDAWERYSGGQSWDYRIVAPGFKYNLTDIAAAIGMHQVVRAEEMRLARERVAGRYLEAFATVGEIELPPTSSDRLHSWHLFPIRLVLDRLDVDRNQFVTELREHGVGFSVHWRPLHLHPYYEGLGWRPEDCPVATEVWRRLVSLPIFPGMTDGEVDRVIEVVSTLCAMHGR